MAGVGGVTSVVFVQFYCMCTVLLYLYSSDVLVHFYCTSEFYCTCAVLLYMYSSIVLV